jgi:hypothetical protein
MWLTMKRLQELRVLVPDAAAYLSPDRITCGFANGAYLCNITNRMNAAGEYRLVEELERYV